MRIKQLIRLWRSRGCYIIADPEDSSITLSKRLFSLIKKKAEREQQAKAFMFKITNLPGKARYGFIINPRLKEQPYLCDIQYNEKYKCIGFETQYPTVGTIFYEYGLPADRKVRLSISICSSKADKETFTYYKIEKPNAKHIRKYQKSRYNIP